MKIGDIVYYAQIMPTIPSFNIIELKVRTINEENLEDIWFVGVENRTKHAYLFNINCIGKSVFLDRDSALKLVKLEESKCNKKDDGERLYEEY